MSFMTVFYCDEDITSKLYTLLYWQ